MTEHPTNAFWDFYDQYSEHEKRVAWSIAELFEEEVQAGKMPRLEEFLERGEAKIRPLLVRYLLEVDIQNCKLALDAWEIEYTQRLPEYAEGIRAVRQHNEYERQQASTTVVAPVQTPSAVQIPDLKLKHPEEFIDIKYIDKGSFSFVYSGIWVADGRQIPVVLKRAKQKPQKHSFSGIPDLKSIGEIQKRLDHPNIVRFLGMTEDVEGNLILIEELVDGPNLDIFLKNAGKLPLDSVVDWILQLVAAVEHMHSQGIYHFDLKPGNILGFDTARIKPKISDFGAAVVWESLRNAHNFLSLIYAAPEQLAPHHSSRGPRSDIFALGVILFELLTEKRPFHSEEAVPAYVERQTNNPPAPRSFRPDISPKLNAICLKCLQFRPEDRYSSAKDLLEALQSLESSPNEHSEAALLQLRPLTAQDHTFYHTLLKAIPNSSLATQIQPLLYGILPPEDANSTAESPRILALSGPSGAGKSTWFAAGVLPTLRERDNKEAVTVVMLNAEEKAADAPSTAESTAEKLRQLLIYRLSLPRTTDTPLAQILSDWIAASADNSRRPLPARKLLIVIDQFEQWLNVHGQKQTSQLQQALKLCDGHLVQALLIFRSDFIDRAEKFMRGCDSRRADGSSGFSIDPLTGDEAATILDHLLSTPGAASRWPQESDRQIALQHAGKLLSDAAKRHGGVCPAWVVMVARFLVKHASDPLQLQHQRSLSDVALSRISELLEGPAGSPLPLAALYPDIVRCLIDEETGGDLRRPVSFDQFRRASLKGTTADSLRQALQRLESDDLIIHMQVNTAGRPEAVWQLTHEIWIQPLRQWLDHIPRSKAESLLANRTAAWIKSGESRHLLNTGELVQVVRYVPAARRSADHERFIGASRFKVARNWLLAMLIAGLLPVWMTVTAVAWGVRAANLGRATPISEIRNAPWFVKPLVVSTLTAELADRQPNDSDGATVEHNEEMLPLRLALLDLIPDNSDHFRRESQAIIDGMNAVPEKLRVDVLDVLQRHATAIQQTTVARFDNAMKQATPADQAALRADHAVLMFLLGRLTECNAALTSHDEDYSDRTLFISRLAPWLSIDQARRALQAPTLSTLPATQAAVLTALDQQPHPTVDMITVVNECLTSDSAAVASTAEYLMQKWNLPAPDPATRKQSGVDWIRIPDFDLFLIRVQIPADQSTGTAASELWVARTELTAGQIRATAQKLIRDNDGNGTDLLPATERTMNEWLEIISELNKRCGFPVTWEQRSDGWSRDAGARGFRVLMLDEGLHVAGAGYPSARPLGRYLDDGFYFGELSRYAVGQSMSGTEKNGVLAVGSRRPNAMGFVDGLGNLSEVVLDQFSEDKMAGSRFARNFARYTIGGDFQNDGQLMRLDPLGWIPNADVLDDQEHVIREDNTGIRIVCDAPEAELRRLLTASAK
jgi:serine/threonine protein kinase